MTKIEWTRNADGSDGKTWNPIRARRKSNGHTMAAGSVGWYCQKVSPGCKNCYAEAMNLFRGNGIGYTVPELSEVELYLDENTLLEPLRWRKPTNVFVCSMTDLFADFVPSEWLDRMFAIMALSQPHTFQVLTKRPERRRAYLLNEDWQAQVSFAMREVIESNRRRFQTLPDGFTESTSDPSKVLVSGGIWEHTPLPLPNVWQGVTVENQAAAHERIPLLRQTPAAVRFLSCEPLLELVDVATWIRPKCANCGAYIKTGLWDGLEEGDESRLAHLRCGCRFCWHCSDNRGRHEGHESHAPDGLSWVICGGESGYGARPMHPDWARSLRDQCQAAGIPFFFKQWGEYIQVDERTVNRGQIVRVDGACFEPVGKKAAGAILDGREWREFPNLIGDRHAS